MNIIEKDLMKFSTIRTNAYAKYFCLINSIDDLKEAIEFTYELDLKFVIIGNGSNILFSRSTYDDVLFIKLSGEFDFFEIGLDSINIGAAYHLKLAGKQLINHGYSDYIFFNLIPACIGGAVTQNAGTKDDGEIRDVCEEITVFDILEKKVINLNNDECMFDYRDSIIKKVPNRYIVLSAKFDKSNQTKNIHDLKLKSKLRISEKVDREPIGYSFGSTFKNSKMPAWKCVESVLHLLDSDKSAFYSSKHYNWIINNNAMGEEIVKLIRDTQDHVRKKLNIKLENEVRII